MTDPPTTLPPAVVEARLCVALHSIRATYAGSLTPTQRGSMGHQTRAPYPSLLIPAYVLDIRRDTRMVLARWAWDVVTTQNLTSNMYVGDVAALTHLLIVHSATLAALPDGVLAMEQLEHASTALAAISTPATEVGSTCLGACPLTTDGSRTTCGGVVRSLDGQGTCAKCGMTGDDLWWEHHMFPDASRLVTATELVREIHQQRGQRVTEGAIRVWATRGLIISVGKDDAGRSLFDKGAVARALASRDCA